MERLFRKTPRPLNLLHLLMIGIFGLSATNIFYNFHRYAKSNEFHPFTTKLCCTYELNKKLTRKQRKEKKGAGGSSKASLHTKSFVFDRKQVFIGSLNLDPRAVLHNTEIGVVLKVPEIAEEMAKWFEENIEQVAFRLELKKDENGYEQLIWHGWEKGEQVVYTHEPHTGFWRRFGIGFMSIWPIESQL